MAVFIFSFLGCLPSCRKSGNLTDQGINLTDWEHSGILESFYERSNESFPCGWFTAKNNEKFCKKHQKPHFQAILSLSLQKDFPKHRQQCHHPKNSISTLEGMGCFIFKSALLGLRQILAAENLLIVMKNTFYFTLKTLFVPKIFKFLSWIFGHVEKRID